MSRLVSTSLASGLTLTADDDPLTIAAAGSVISPDSTTGLFAPPVGQSWQITNDGTVQALQAAYGIALFAPGTVTVGDTNPTALVTAGVVAVDLNDPADALVNGGTITTQGAEGVLLGFGGTVANGGSGDTVATISGVNGIFASGGGPASLSNEGTVQAIGQYGVYFAQGGTVTNGNAARADGVISGVFTGVYVSGGAGSVTNYGSIAASGLAGILLDDPGTVINGSTSDTTASVSGQITALFWTSGSATVDNFATISATGAFGIVGVGGGTVVNGAPGDMVATIAAPNTAVFLVGGQDSITNYGTIASSAAFGIVTTGTTTLDNLGLLTGGIMGVVTTSVGIISNAGTITGGSSTGVWLSQGGTLTNGAPGAGAAQVSGGIEGALITGPGATIVNDGTLAGVVGLFETSGSAGAASDIIDAGLIESVNGAAGVALSFSDPGSTLTLQPGASLTGAVLGGGGVLELASGAGTLSGIGHQFVNFATVSVDAGAAWTVSGGNTIAAGSALALTGSLAIAAGGTLDLEAAPTGAGSLDLGGAGTQVLVLGAATSGRFASQIVDVGAGDAIVLAGRAATGATTAKLTAGAGGTSVVTVTDSTGAVIATLASVSFAGTGLGFTDSTANGAVMLVATAVAAPSAPAVSAALADDTGSSATDGVTTDPSVNVTAAAAAGLAALTATLDGGAASANLLASVSSTGTLALTAAQIDALAPGGTLAPGGHLVRLLATDSLGQSGTFALAFTIDGGATFALTPVGPYATGSGTLSLSGVASDPNATVTAVTASLDGGTPVAVGLGAGDGFAINTAAVFGAASAAGTHDLKLFATTAGGAGGSIDVPFTVGTGAPAVTVSAPATAGTLTQGALLSGVATPGLGSLVGLSYAFDGGTAHPITFDPTTGNFATALDLSALAVGTHELSVTALDSSGGVTTVTEAETLPALVPLTVTSLTPANGAGQIGTTYRPVVTFSRAVNPASLTGSSFYATDPSGNVLPATIVPSADGLSATMFFTGAMPGASTVTLHVVGSLITGAADGAKLDADDDGMAGSALSSTLTTVSTAGVPGCRVAPWMENSARNRRYCRCE